MEKKTGMEFESGLGGRAPQMADLGKVEYRISFGLVLWFVFGVNYRFTHLWRIRAEI